MYKLIVRVWTISFAALLVFAFLSIVWGFING